MIRRIDHIAINIVNIGRSIDFYSRILGFEQLQRVDCGDFDIIYIGLPSGSRLELFDYHAKNRSKPREESEVGLRHLAFEVIMLLWKSMYAPKSWISSRHPAIYQT